MTELDHSLSPAYLQRFGGIARLYGQAALEHLSRAHFAIIGVGGVGTWVAEALARSGVGQITLVDMDDICITNTNRQIHALQSTIGQQKIDALAARLKDINPEIKVNAVDNFLDKLNIKELITDDMDVVMDTFDVGHLKAALIANCKIRKKLIITIGSAGGKLDPTKITHGDLSKTVNDPLLAKTRNSLRRQYNFTRNPKKVFSIEAIYSTEQMTYPLENGGTCQSKTLLSGGTLEGGNRLDCNGGFGAATMVTGSFGFLAVSRAVTKFLARKARES